MKVFISWSGDRSRAIAEILDDWLQCVLQAVDPWMSSKDIDRGSLWFSELSNQLADTSVGIVCLTQDNKEKPWILFESGALAKGLSSARVCTFLIDLKTTDIDDPLAQFNHSNHTKEGVFGLLRTINVSLGERALNNEVLRRVFETYWPQFRKDFDKALEENPLSEKIEPRTEDNMMHEILTSIRRVDRKVRELEKTDSSSSDVRNQKPTGDFSNSYDKRNPHDRALAWHRAMKFHRDIIAHQKDNDTDEESKDSRTIGV